MNASAARALPFAHTPAFRRRRFLNWFPLGLTYALLYMGRYNLTVAAVALGALMTKEDFGLIFGAGTAVYAIAFLLNGPVTDKLGGKRAILASSLGAAVMNLLMGLFIRHTVLNPGTTLGIGLVPTMSVLYALNMYFQSFGAVAIVKVNASWFHVRERGGFSGIFGTMISSGIFFAFTVNGWLLRLTTGWGPGGGQAPWWVFFVPSAVLFLMFIVELVLLRDRPGQAGHEDFDTGDASSGDAGDVTVKQLIWKILSNPIILTVAFVEFCTGVLRNGVMHWFPFYVKEVWALPPYHPLRDGSWGRWEIVVGMFAIAAAFFVLASRAGTPRRRAAFIISGVLVALAPFFQAGWGGLLFVAGVIGGNVAGWVSDLFFQSRRAPAAGGLYGVLALCALGMVFVLGGTTTVVGWSDDKLALRPGDEILSIAGKDKIASWRDASEAVACIPSRCIGEGVHWDGKRCMCSSKAEPTSGDLAYSSGTIDAVVRRDNEQVTLSIPDLKREARAGDRRALAAGPKLPLSPFFLGAFAFLVSLCVIGTHGLLSGTATMDFGGRKGAATAVGLIDGFVYLGTALQSVALGYLTSKNWIYWPLFLLPFALLGFYLLTRIWHAKPKGAGGGH